MSISTGFISAGLVTAGIATLSCLGPYDQSKRPNAREIACDVTKVALGVSLVAAGFFAFCVSEHLADIEGVERAIQMERECPGCDFYDMYDW